MDTRHSPANLTQHMFDTGKNLAARSRVTRILHLDRHCHVSLILYKVTCNYFLSKPVKASQMTPSRVVVGRFLTSSC